ncbi:MAG: hypothetical protein ACRCSB_00675, partial [Bacteroidales bacterium]
MANFPTVRSISASPTEQEWLMQAGINLQKFVGKPADEQLYNKVIQRFVCYYENSGYPFVWAQFDSIQIDSLFWSAVFRCDRGNKIVIDTFIVKGELRLRPKFLPRYLGLRKPKLYSETYVQSIDRNINNLSFLQTTQPSSIEFRMHKANLFSWVEKKNANYANGLFAFYSDENQRIRLQGEADIFLTNVFGGGEEYSLEWSSPSKNWQRLDIAINIPYLIVGNIGVDVNFCMQRIDTLHITIGGKLRLFSKINSILTGVIWSSLYKYNNLKSDAKSTSISKNLYGFGLEVNR